MARYPISTNFADFGKDKTSTLISNCSDLTGVSSEGHEGTTVTQSTEFAEEGTGTWQFYIPPLQTADNHCTVVIDGLALDLSDKENICIKFHIPVEYDADRFAETRFAVTISDQTGGAWTSSYMKTPTDLLSGVKRVTDNVMVLDLSAAVFTSSAGGYTPQTHLVNQIRIQMFKVSADTAKYMYIDAIYAGLRPRTKLCLTLDDNTLTQYSYLFPILKSHNIPATMYINLEKVGVGGLGLTTAQIKEMQDDAGCCIANHCNNHDGWVSTVTDDADRTAQWQACDDYLAANGFNGRDYMAYVGGQYDDSVISLVQSLGVKMARCTEQGYGANGGTIPDGGNHPATGRQNMHNVYTDNLGIGQIETGAAALAKLDSCIRTGHSYFVYGHNFVATPTLATEFSSSEMTIFMDGVKERMDAGLVDPLTVKDYYEQMTNPKRSAK